jgi:L-lactate dehydrogenase (cytochrome)
MTRPVCIDDYRLLAKKRVPRILFEYLDGGSFAEVTLRRNLDDMRALKLRQRVMRDVSDIDLSVDLFGQTLSLPIVLGPVGAAVLYARRGEAAAAKAAVAAGTTACLSTVALCGVEEVTEAAGEPIWFQLYMIRDRAFMERMLARARAQKCRALVFTVDMPMPGVRYGGARTSMGGPLPLSGRIGEAVDALSRVGWLWDVMVRGRPHVFGNVAEAVGGSLKLGDYLVWLANNFDPSINWDDIAWIRRHWDGPLILKGVLDAEDARHAVDLGCDGVVVSNHGGRQLDGVPSAIEALPPIVKAVGERTTVLMDGGVRSGLDVVKALALGAKAVMIGRAWAYPLAARGQAGVAHGLELLRREMTVAMALTACTRASDAGPHMLA